MNLGATNIIHLYISSLGEQEHVTLASNICKFMMQAEGHVSTGLFRDITVHAVQVQLQGKTFSTVSSLVFANTCRSLLSSCFSVLAVLGGT